MLNGNLFSRAIQDLESLRTPYGFKASSEEGIFPVEFGRDQLVGILQLREVTKIIPSLLPIWIEDAKRVLRSLASWQGNKVDHRENQEPGKIGHEHWVFDKRYFARLENFEKSGRYIRRNGPLTPPELFRYDASDPSCLWGIVLDETIQTTNDQKFKKEMLPHLYQVIDWIFKYGGLSEKPFLNFEVGSKPHLRFQTWRDSEDAIQNPDGSFPQGELAVDYIQGLAYQFLLSAARIMAAENPQLAQKLVWRANQLKEDFNHYFWQKGEGYFAEAIDRQGRQIGDLSSSPAEILWTGIIDQEKVPLVVKRVLQSDFWTPYGIRTISALSPNFDQTKYQKGNIWPQANKMIHQGLLFCGFEREARELEDNNLAAFHFFGRFKENWTYQEGDEYPGSLSQSNNLQFWALTAYLSFLADKLAA